MCRLTFEVFYQFHGRNRFSFNGFLLSCFFFTLSFLLYFASVDIFLILSFLLFCCRCIFFFFGFFTSLFFLLFMFFVKCTSSEGSSQCDFICSLFSFCGCLDFYFLRSKIVIISMLKTSIKLHMNLLKHCASVNQTTNESVVMSVGCPDI